MSLGAARTEPGNCKPQFEVRLPPPSLTTNAGKKHHSKGREKGTAIRWTLKIASPVFGPPSPGGSCAQYSMLDCAKQMGIVAVNSKPSGAEIWVDGKRKGDVSPVTLSVPFCPSRPTASLVLHQSGHVNCKKSLDLVANQKVTVVCALLPLPKSL